MKPIRNPLRGFGRWLFGIFQGGTQSPGTIPQNNPLSTVPPTAEELMQSAMSEAMSLTDTTDSGPEKIFYEVLAMVCYIGPFVIAVLVGTWIGDGLSALTHANPSDTNTYRYISMFVELFVPVMSTACARAVKRTQVDPSAMGMMIAALACFVVLGIGSGVAQWFIYTAPYGNAIPTGIVVVSIFKGSAPIIADVGAGVYLSLHGYKSLKRKLAQLDERADAVGKIFTKQAIIIDQSEKQRKEREDADAERERRAKKEGMIDRVYEMMGESFVGAMENYLSIGPAAGSNGSSRQQRGGF
jgi:hypothetical protein